jgi:2-oxoisovalerate dehydrogenase E1 component alpha subunit
MARAGSAPAQSLSPDQLETLYSNMVLARALDERMWILNRQGKVHFVISGQGHEAAQVGVAMALDRDRDILCPYYRDLALVLAWGMTPREVMLASLGRAADPNSGGRQMPSHWGHREKRIISGSSPVTTQMLHATGAAWASRYRGEQAVAVASFGEGSSNQGEFHEALNFASVHRVPVVFVCENNGYAISVPAKRQMAVESVAARAAGYGIPGVSVDGTDPVAVYEAAKAAVDRARRGDGPSLLECRVIRMTAHSSDDDDRSYRSREELKAERERDPVPRFRQWLVQQGLWNDEREEALRKRVRAIVDDATDYAEQAPLPDPDTLMDHVYHDDADPGARAFAP